VSPGGYLWWYLDVLSDDGPHALTIIVFVGSVFSPFYFRARRRGEPEPENHPAVNVALYGPRGERGWVFTERDGGALERSDSRLVIGPNQVGWEKDALMVRFDERTAPVGSPLVGEVRLHPVRCFDAPVTLDEAGRHHWWSVAPKARAEVKLSAPALRFSGSAYHDSNWGDEPLEDGFSYWNWSRAELAEGTAVLYDAVRREGGAQPLGFLYRDDGTVASLEAPASVRLANTLFRVPRATRTDQSGGAKVVRTLEDTPFYNRSELQTRLSGQSVRAVHEAVDLDRFRRRWVQFMLPYRMRHTLTKAG
jgi:carotenoid 1,2-hydratase